MSEKNKIEEEISVSETSIPIMTILRSGLVFCLSYIFYGYMGIKGIIVGFILGFIPIVGPATLLVIGIWGDKIFG